MSLKRGQELFDEDDGRRWLVYKKQRRHLTQPYAAKAGSYNGYYYYPADVDVTSSNWEEHCEWTVEEEVLLWAQAAFNGDGLTAGADPTAAQRANGFDMHPLLLKDLHARFEAAEVDGALRVELLKNALKAQKQINDALRSEKRGYVVALMAQSHNIMEMLAHKIFAGLVEKSRRRIDMDAPVAPYVNRVASVVLFEQLWFLKRLLKMAGFVCSGDLWTAADAVAVLGIIGSNALKTGTNCLRRVRCYGPMAIQKYCKEHGQSHHNLYSHIAQLHNAQDAIIYQAAPIELGDAALGSDGKLLPAWQLRDALESAWTNPENPIDQRVRSFSHVKLDTHLNFSIRIKPIRATQPRGATPIELGADLILEYAWNTMRRGAGPSGESSMIPLFSTIV
jgi:hypothetical protein